MALLVVAAPEGAANWGSVGLLTGLAGIAVGVAASIMWRRRRRNGDVWGWRRGAVWWGALAVLATTVGTLITIGNFRVVRYDLTLIDKNTPSRATRNPQLFITAAGHRQPFRVERDVHDLVQVGDHVRCRGVDPPLIRVTLTRCRTVRP